MCIMVSQLQTNHGWYLILEVSLAHFVSKSLPVLVDFEGLDQNIISQMEVI